MASAGADAPPGRPDPALAQISFGFRPTAPATSTAARPGTARQETQAGARHRLPGTRLPDFPPPGARSPVGAHARLARTQPRPTLLVTLSEALAYRADEIAYFQDAVATEAYLGTARQRVSVKRHTAAGLPAGRGRQTPAPGSPSRSMPRPTASSWRAATRTPAWTARCC